MNRACVGSSLDVLLMVQCLFVGGAAFAQSAGSPAPAADQEVVVPALEQVSPRLDLGLGRPMSLHTGTVTLMNVGDKPIRLGKVQGECSCTDATVLHNKRVLEPGEDVEILIAVEFPREMGNYTKGVLVFEEGNPAPFYVPIDMEVGYPVRVNGGARFAIVVSRIGTLRLESTENRNFSVLSVHGVPPEFEDYDPLTEPPRASYLVKHDWSNVPRESLPRWMVIETDHPGAEMMAIPARIQGWTPIIDKKSWRPVDEFILLGRIKSGSTTRAHMLFSGKAVQAGKRVDVESSNPDLLVRIANVRKPDRGGGMHVDFDITPRVGARGFVQSVITLKYDGATTAFDLFARIVE